MLESPEGNSYRESRKGCNSMLVLLDNINDVIYGDIVISPKELIEMRSGNMLEGKATLNGKKYYIGVRLQGLWDEEDEGERKD